MHNEWMIVGLISFLFSSCTLGVKGTQRKHFSDTVGISITPTATVPPDVSKDAIAAVHSSLGPIFKSLAGSWGNDATVPVLTDGESGVNNIFVLPLNMADGTDARFTETLRTAVAALFPTDNGQTIVPGPSGGKYRFSPKPNEVCRALVRARVLSICEKIMADTQTVLTLDNAVQSGQFEFVFTHFDRVEPGRSAELTYFKIRYSQGEIDGGIEANWGAFRKIWNYEIDKLGPSSDQILTKYSGDAKSNVKVQLNPHVEGQPGLSRITVFPQEDYAYKVNLAPETTELEFTELELRAPKPLDSETPSVNYVFGSTLNGALSTWAMSIDLKSPVVDFFSKIIRNGDMILAGSPGVTIHVSARLGLAKFPYFSGTFWKFNGGQHNTIWLRGIKFSGLKSALLSASRIDTPVMLDLPTALTFPNSNNPINLPLQLIFAASELNLDIKETLNGDGKGICYQGLIPNNWMSPSFDLMMRWYTNSDNDSLKKAVNGLSESNVLFWPHGTVIGVEVPTVWEHQRLIFKVLQGEMTQNRGATGFETIAAEGSCFKFRNFIKDGLTKTWTIGDPITLFEKTDCLPSSCVWTPDKI